MTAAEVKEALRRRYPATAYMGSRPIPGPWTCVEEWCEIDLLAIGATQGAERWGWIGHEVKVSRGDLRAELLNPSKREAYKSHCDMLYLVVPDGLLKPEEIAYEEPVWPAGAFRRVDCPVCENDRPRRDSRRSNGWPVHGSLQRVPVPVDLAPGESGKYGSWLSLEWDGWTKVKCVTCGGKGWSRQSHVERTAPTLWVPRDVGLLVVNGRGVRQVKAAPRWKRDHAMSYRQVADLVRWASARPDPRHAGVVAAARALERESRAAR